MAIHDILRFGKLMANLCEFVRFCMICLHPSDGVYVMGWIFIFFLIIHFNTIHIV